MSGVLNKQLDRPILQYTLAAVLVLAAFVAHQIVVLHFGIDLPEFITFYPAIMLIALLFGLRAGLLASALASVLAEIWIFPPFGQFGKAHVSDVIALIFFFSMGVFVSLVADRYRRDQRRLAGARQQLALRQTWERLEEQSAYRRLALEAAELGAWDYQLQTGEVVWDECCRNGFGFSTGEKIDYAAAIDRIHPDDRPGVDEAVKQAIAGANAGAYHREFRVVWPDGSLHWISSHGKVYFDGQDGQRRATRFIGVNADITARKQAESILETTLQRFYVILSNLYSGVLLVTNEGQVEFANQALCDRFGIENSPASLVGMESGDMLGKIKGAYRDPDQAVARIAQIVAAGQSVSGEELAMRDGGTCLRDCVPLTLDGKSHGRLWVFTDITERTRMEDDLRQAKREWERTFDSVPDLIAILDNRHRIVRVNQAMAQRLGSKPEECIGLECFGCVHGTSGPISNCPHALTLKDGREHSAEIHEERLGGDFLVTTTPLLDEHGNMDGAVHVARDITDAKRAEAALQRSEEQFRTLANAIPQLSWMANADGGIFWYNDRWYEYTGTTPEQMEGWGWQSVHDPEALPKVLERWRGTIATGQPFDMVFPLRGADGVFRPFLTRVMPLKDADGKVVRWFGTNTDITERKRAEDALLESEERYRSLFNSMNEGFCIIEVLFDANGKAEDYRFLQVNAAFEKQTGLSGVEGKRMRELVPDNEEYWFEIYGKIALTGEPAHFMDQARALNR
jgi:PAS domain S-box-containing protein